VSVRAVVVESAAAIWRHARCNATIIMKTMTIESLERRPRDAQLDYGFRPMRNARWYKRAQAWLLSATNRRYEVMVADEKRALLTPLAGTVLEIGPGGGGNLAFLSTLQRGGRWIGVEPNPFFHERLRARGERLGIDVDVRTATAEALPAADHSVDAVISSLVLCSVRDPRAALREVRRVLRPGGRFVFVEHVAAPRGSALHAVQRALRPIWGALSDGCHPDRDTGLLIEEAGFASVDLRRFRLPVPIMGPHVAGIARG
jgi:SAM-dependent methyltransferase